MRFQMWPFNFNSNRFNLAILFGAIAFIFLFSMFIIKLIAIVAIAFLGWVIGTVLDDNQLVERMKLKFRNVFSRR